LERIDHAAKRGGPTTLHEFEDCDEHVYRLLGGRAEHTSLHRTAVPDSGDLRIQGRGTVATLVGRFVF
jgi:hypothetical protein